MNLTNAMSFDTLAYIRCLTRGGFSDHQAEVLMTANKQLLSDVADTHLATKSDILMLKEDISTLREGMQALRLENKSDIWTLKEEMHVLKQDMRVMHWMLGFLVVGVCSIAIKTFWN